MNIYESAEDYLERILMLSQKMEKVRSIDIAIDMNYSKPSISKAIKKLKEAEYINVEDDGAITLTKKGQDVASNIYDRHTTLTEYFMSLGVPESIAQNDACKVEHDISIETFNAIKAQLHKK